MLEACRTSRGNSARRLIRGNSTQNIIRERNLGEGKSAEYQSNESSY